MSRMFRTAALSLFVLAGVLLVVQPGAARVKVRADFDKTFDFTTVKTWGWKARMGDVMAVRTQKDDAEAIRLRVDPILKSEVAAVMPSRKLQESATAPDVTLAYYLLLTAGTSTQEMGQFLPATVNWGLPMFAPATTSYEVIEKGSLVFDFTAHGQVIWRGLAEAKIDWDSDQKKREQLLRESARELLKKFPPKS